jgi:hypothetical protein
MTRRKRYPTCHSTVPRRRGDVECSDTGGVSHHRNNAPLPLTEPDRWFGPTTAFRMRDDGLPASSWMWAKARRKLGAVIRLCRDGVTPNVAIMEVLLRIIETIHPFTHRTGPLVPTHHRTADAQRWCSLLAMDEGEGQKQARCGDSPVRRRGDAACSENGVVCMEIHPFCTQKRTVRSDPPPLLRIPRNGPFRPTTALPTPPVGVPASPWMWAKARSKLGALIRPCGMVSNKCSAFACSEWGRFAWK